MNRRDMIIAAVLVNVALLIFFVVTSVKSEKKELPIVASRNVSDLEESVTLSPAPKKKKELAALSLRPKSIPSSVKKVNSPPLKLQEEKKEDHSPSPMTPSPQREVVVQKGDVLEKIARLHGVSVESIQKLNHLQNTRLQIGQHLKIPPSQKKEEKKDQPKEKVKEHIVKEGESPWTIAKQHNMKVEELLNLNGLTEKEAKKLRPGRHLKLE